MIVAVCAALDFLKADGNGGSLFKGGEKVFVLFHVARQRVYGKVGKLPALGLRHVKDSYHLKGGDCDFFSLGDGLPVPADYGALRFRVDFLHFLFHLERRRGNDTDTLFAPFDVAPKLIFPSVKARDKGSVRLLHGDQYSIANTVIMKLRHDA